MEDNSLLSFNFKDIVGDKEHDYRVTMNYNSYDLERDGTLIATLVHDTEWQQLTGVPLSDDFIRWVGERIESQYD